MIAISPSKNVIAPINASMIAAKPIQPVHAEDMSRRVSIVLMHRSFLGRRDRRGSGTARGSDVQYLLLLRLEFVVRQNSLVVQLRQVRQLLGHVWLGRGGLGRGSCRLLVGRLRLVVHRHLTARRASCGTARHSATWSEHGFFLSSSGRFFLDATTSTVRGPR